ncbi:hypothetical protein F511_31570 [Dorcoceras hygrometricum]|uniref:Uncharacterized protein n=1 Tax=Dorcoceras hygrometricum TaxID=472368 RepID=A0A2Z7CYJ7_9LAMI|nr:hypothetical protein F511_31570 [Dorcoceras hygrometricum]
MVNAGQRSCACDWLCWYVATGTRRGKRCALFCVLRLDDQQLVLRILHPMRRRLDKLVRRRFEDQSMVCLVSDFSVRSTGCPAFVFRNSVWLSSCERLFATVVSDWFCLAWLEISSAVGYCVCWFGNWRLGLRIVISFPILSKYFQPFVPYLSNPRTLFSRELFRRFPVVPVVVLARARLLPESSGFLAGLVVAQYKHATGFPPLRRRFSLVSGCTGYLLVLATAGHKPSADYDDVTDDIINAKPSADSLARPLQLIFIVPAPASDLHLLILQYCSSAVSSFLNSDCQQIRQHWLSSFQLIHYAPTGSTWPPPDYKQLIQLWTSPSLIQLQFYERTKPTAELIS